MTESPGKLPVQRAIVEETVGTIVGVFQIDRKSPLDRSEARSLPTDGAALVAVADGGRLNEVAFNMWTLALEFFSELGYPESNRIDTSATRFAVRAWGPRAGRSAEKRRKVIAGLDSLLETPVLITGIDPFTQERTAGSVWKMNLLEAAGIHGDISPVLKRARSDDPEEQRVALAELAGMSNSSTVSVVLPQWLADGIRRGRGVILDFEIQRKLRGSAKRIWIQLQTQPGWAEHRIPKPAGREALQAELAHLIQAPLGTQTVLPTDDEPSIDVETLVIELDSDAYEAFGITHDNRKRDLAAACRSILASDRTFLRADFVRRGRKLNGRQFELHIIRAAGEFRQDLMRRVAHERVERAKELEAAKTAA